MPHSPDHQARPVCRDFENLGPRDSSPMMQGRVAGQWPARNPASRAGPWFVAAIGLCLALGGCDRPVPSGRAPSVKPAAETGMAGGGARGKQADFLNQIRQADPEFRTIERALLNEENELGLILDRSVDLEKIPALMRLMLTKMAAQFPGVDLTVLAYTPSKPPQKVGTARLNARTRDMTYTPE